MSDERGERKRGYGDSYRNDRGGNTLNLFSCLCFFFNQLTTVTRLPTETLPEWWSACGWGVQESAWLRSSGTSNAAACFYHPMSYPLGMLRGPEILIKHSVVHLQEKNPRFREKGDSDEEEDDYDKRRRRWTCGTIVACMQLFWCPVTAEELTKCSSICFTLLYNRLWLILVGPVLCLVPVIC